RDVEPLGDLDHAHGPVQPQLGEDGGAAADDQLPFARGHVASSRSTGRRPLCRLPGGRAGRGERTDHKRSPSVDARGSRREDQVMTTPWPAAWGPAPAPDDRTSPLTGYTREHWVAADRKSTRLNSSHVKISYAVFCSKKTKKQHRAQYLVTNRHRLRKSREA